MRRAVSRRERPAQKTIGTRFAFWQVETPLLPVMLAAEPLTGSWRVGER